MQIPLVWEEQAGWRRKALSASFSSHPPDRPADIINFKEEGSVCAPSQLGKGQSIIRAKEKKRAQWQEGDTWAPLDQKAEGDLKMPLDPSYNLCAIHDLCLHFCSLVPMSKRSHNLSKQC